MAEVVEKAAEEGAGSAEFIADSPPKLMPEQEAAVRAIGASAAAGTFDVFLLHGVTGSGKTEVYLHCIARLAGSGKGAIVLVPEIALTPQLLGRFRKRFGGRVAVLHSGLTDRERADEYRRISRGLVDVAIGARSAVFAPFPSLGLVVVDEEHENSYKQDEGLRYHARDVAVMRAKFQDAVCVLGSATPSLESFYNARAGKYRYLPIANRVDHRPMPVVEIIDVKGLPKESVYSPDLISAVQQRLDKKEQTLLAPEPPGVLVGPDLRRLRQGHPVPELQRIPHLPQERAQAQMPLLRFPYAAACNVPGVRRHQPQAPRHGNAEGRRRGRGALPRRRGRPDGQRQYARQGRP